jgi:hypothetical protein
VITGLACRRPGAITGSAPVNGKEIKQVVQEVENDDDDSLPPKRRTRQKKGLKIS